MGVSEDLEDSGFAADSGVAEDSGVSEDSGVVDEAYPRVRCSR